MGLEHIRVVLVEPRDAANVGAAARAMKNMGLARLTLVAPPRLDRARAAATAVHAADLLETMTAAPTLAAALAGCGLAVATSGRPSAARAAASPRALAPEIVAVSARNDVALVFGPEDRGLSNEELGLCQRVAAIPASPAYASLNLAQAVLVCAYELHLAAATPPAARALATVERRELMYARLEAALAAIGFLHRDNAVPMMRLLRRALGRADLDDHEVRVVLGIARQIAWAAERAAAARGST